MAPDQTAPKGAVWLGFIVFATVIKSSQKCIWIYAADIQSRQHLQEKIYEINPKAPPLISSRSFQILLILSETKEVLIISLDSYEMLRLSFLENALKYEVIENIVICCNHELCCKSYS